MSAETEQAFNEQVARALAESGHMKIDPSWMEDIPGHSVMVGGFGTVRAAKLFGQIVAVKELRITGVPADRVRFSMRLARELKVWAPLNHPNLLKLYGFYINPDISVAQFISPFYPNGHIRSYIEANNPDRKMRLSLAKDTALGLQHLHQLHIVHGDLKELNVLVDHEPRALLCDYGLAKIVDPEGTGSGFTTTGGAISSRFASPELIEDARPDMASDIWAWGCLFLKIILNIDPYNGAKETARIRKITQGVPPTDLSTMTMTMSVNLRGMLERCWNRDPLARLEIVQCVEIIDLEQRPHHLVSIWNTSSEISMHILKFPISYQAQSVAFSPDGSLVVSAFLRDGVQLWDADSCRHVASLSGTDFPIGNGFTTANFSPNGMRLVCGTEDGLLSVWDVIPTASPGLYPSWKRNEDTMPSTSSDVRSTAFSPDGLLLAVGCKAGGKVYCMGDRSSWKLLFNMGGHGRGYTRSIAFSPTGRWLASGGEDNVVQIWDTATPAIQGAFYRVPVKLESHAGEVNSVAFSPDERWLATGSNDTTIVIWGLLSWNSVVTSKNERQVTSLAFSPDNTRLVSGIQNGNVQLWDTASWTIVMMLEGHGPGFIWVAFSPVGNRIASASKDRTIRIWHANPATTTTQDP